MSAPSTAMPAWAQITLTLVGSGGLLGLSALLFNLFKQVTDAKDTRIETLTQQIALLRQDHSDYVSTIQNSHQETVGNLQRELDQKNEELRKIGDFRQLIEESVDDLISKGITPETSASLRKIEAQLASMQSNQELLSGMRTAARWVQHRKEEWLELCVQTAISQCADFLPQSATASFKQDLSNYLLWLQDSLQHGFVCEIADYVRQPSIKSPFPYRAAFQALKEMNDFGQLEPVEVQDLQSYIYELARITAA